jgi:hypothetical protein
MSRFCASAVIALTALVLSFNAANPGAKRQHNSSVKAQCVSDAESKNLAGHDYDVAVRGCRQNGSFTGANTASRRTAAAQKTQ